MFRGKRLENKLIQTCQNIQIEVLDRLHKIRPGLIETWFQDDRQMFGQLGEVDRIALRTELEEIFAADKDMAMEDWFKKAHTALWRAGIGV